MKNEYFKKKSHSFSKPNNRSFYERDSAMPRKKKALGQHFLRKQSTVDNMIAAVKTDAESTILEIGCGDGFLTQSILSQTKCKKLVCYEIDEEWAKVVREKIRDPRLDLRLLNILDVQPETLALEAPLIVLANIPYQITFPLFYLFHRCRELLLEGVVMMQEEVAQKLVASHGKKFGAATMFFQHYFEFKLLEKIEPGAFIPPPKVHSRLLYFKPKSTVTPIPDEENFWKFVKLCFQFPRRTLQNNLRTTHYQLETLPADLLTLRAQQLSFEHFLAVWTEMVKLHL